MISKQAFAWERRNHKKAHQQVDQRAGCSPDGGQRLLADKLAHDNRVRRVIKLLKKRAQNDREEKQQQLLPDHAFCDAVDRIPCLAHMNRSSSIDDFNG